MRIPEHFEILGELGEGGMGAVYLARDTSSGVQCALKCVAEGKSERESLIARLRNEFEILSTLSDVEGVVRAHGFYEEFGCLSLEFVDGAVLKEWAESHLPGDRAADRAASQELLMQKVLMLRRLASALGQMHERGLVHRDVKPSNVILRGGAPTDPILIDFGLCAPEGADPGARVAPEGSPIYMSPEEIRSEAVDRRADVYSFGVLACEVLSGELPFRLPQSSDVRALYASHLIEKVRAPQEIERSIPSWLNRLVLICLEKNRAERFPSFQPLIEMIDAHLNSLPSGQGAGAVRSVFARWFGG